MSGPRPAAGGTAAAQLLSKIYLLELAQTGTTPVMVKISFDDRLAHLTCCSGELLSAPTDISSGDLFAALEKCVTSLRPAFKKYPETIYDDTPVHLWAELCYDLAQGDHVLDPGDGSSLLEEIVWRETFATVSGNRAGVKRSLDVPLIPGSMETAISWDLWSLFSDDQPS